MVSNSAFETSKMNSPSGTQISLGWDYGMKMVTFLWGPMSRKHVLLPHHCHTCCHIQTLLLPHANPLAATYKPSCCHIQTLLLPHANPLAATCKPSCCHIQTLLLPHVNPLAATCKPSCCHTSTLFLPHINPAAATYQQNLAACCYTLAATLPRRYVFTKQDWACKSVSLSVGSRCR